LPFTEIWVKTIDGLAWMSNFDTHPAHVDGIGKVEQLAAMYQSQGLTMRPWVVPHGREAWGITAADEGALAGKIAARSGGVLLVDLEPHEPAPGGGAYYWRDDLGAAGDEVRAYVAAFLANGGRELWLVPDARPGRMPSFADWWALDQVTRVMPQVYWTDFRLGYRDALNRAVSTLTNAGVRRVANIWPVLPANATPEDLAAAIAYVHELGLGGVSVWQRANLDEDDVAKIAALPDPWASASTPTPPPPATTPPSTQESVRSHLVTARAEIDAALAANGG
ncbi:MAG: hypothetical protein AB7I38_18620, partial [Dehalococcoidia bacterium]